MTQNPGELPLGRAARALWTLRGDGTFLNHGSHGAVPRGIQEVQQRLRDEMEQQPDIFFRRIEPSGGAAVRDVAARLAAFTGTTADRMALVENTTSGVQAVLNSLPFQHGDQILITDHTFASVRLAVEARCRQTGAEAVIVRIPLPTDSDQILERILAAAGPQVRFALLDHITSATALVFPVQRIADELRRRGIPLFVDGAHAIGQLPLDLAALGADWYVSNLHKWLYAPRGTAMLYASGSAVPLTWPLSTSHFAPLGFPRSFDYVGTRDYTAWLTAPAALGFFKALEPERLWAHERELLTHGSEQLQRVGIEPVAPPEMSAAMRAFVLPQSRPGIERDAIQVMQTLWERERIETRCVIRSGALLLRISAQAYVEAADLTWLAQALDRHGWPARR